MKIGEAVQALEDGLSVTRKGWNGKHRLAIVSPIDAGEIVNRPYVAIHAESGAVVPWLCSQEDLLASDWQVAE